VHPEAPAGDLGQAAGQLADGQVTGAVQVTAGVLVCHADVEDDLAGPLAGLRQDG